MDHAQGINSLPLKTKTGDGSTDLVFCLYTLYTREGFPAGSVVKNLLANAGNSASILGSGRFPGKGNGNPLQDSCLGIPTVCYKESDTTK